MRPGAAKMRLRNALSFEQPIMRATLHAAAYLPSIVRPMSWLRELKLSDLPPGEALEIALPQMRFCPLCYGGRIISAQNAWRSRR